MEEFEKLSLAKIVSMKPEAASLFEKYHLDFCCKGKQTLNETFINDKQKKDEVTKALKNIFNDKEANLRIKFDDLTLSKLIDYILEIHHRYVKDSGTVILNHLEKVVSKHGEHHPELIKIKDLFTKVKRELDQHMMKEEIILFPRIKEMEFLINNNLKEGKMIYIEAPINVMEAEHEIAGNLLNDINKQTNNYTVPADACTTFRLSYDELRMFEHDLHKHVHLENNLLFPKALLLKSKLEKLVQAN